MGAFDRRQTLMITAMVPAHMRVCIVLHADLFEPWPIVRPMHEVRILQRLGREVAVFCWIKDPASPLPSEEIRDGLEIHRAKVAPPRNPLVRLLRFPFLSFRFAKVIRRLRPDAILCHDLEMLWASVRAGKALRVPVLYHAHEDWPAMVSERSRMEAWAFAWLERRLLRSVDRVYAAGEERAERFRRMGKATTVVYGSKAVSEIPEVSPEQRDAIRARAGLAPSDLVVGIAGSLGRDEALPAVLDALAELPLRVKLFIVGGGGEKVSQARSLVARRGMENRVAFTGRLETEEYLRHTSALDVGLALYYPTTENQRTVVPLKLFDYMGLGIPALVSDFPEMRRIVDGCGCGLPVNPSDANAIRAALERLDANPTERRRMGQRARDCFVHTYSWERQEGAVRTSHPIFMAP